MIDDVAVVWLDGDKGDAEAARALTAWAHARGVELVPASERATTRPPSPALGERVEKEIARAYEAIGGADADTAERALARAEQLLREHPELAQAAWLLAEVDRAWSARWMRVEPKDAARGQSAWEEAEAIDGGRVAGVGEATFLRPPRAKASIVVSGANKVALRVDGVPLEPKTSGTSTIAYETELAAGDHHVYATVGASLVFASWVSTAGPAEIRFTADVSGGCASEELARARRSGGQVDAKGVSCASWVAVAHGDRQGSVLVARCARDVCGPLLEWRAERFEAWGPPQAERKTAPWPAWATWALVGIGGAAATSVALVASGVFEARRTEPRFVVGGAKQE